MFNALRAPKSFLLGLMLVAGVGCADSGEDADAIDTVAESTLSDAPLAQVGAGIKTIKDPKGLYIANVEASGTGCPAGTWSADIAPDGKVFTLVLSKYELKLAKEDRSNTQSIDCDINVSLKSPAGLSYAISTFAYQGYAFLQPGVEAQLQANYHFTGLAQAKQHNSNKTLVGPVDKSYLFKDTISTLDWSPCGTTRSLNISTTLLGQNTSPKQDGYINMNSVDAETNTKVSIIMTLNNKRC